MVNTETDILNSVLTDLLQRAPQKLPFTHSLAYGSDPSEKPIYNLDYCSHCISLLSFSYLHQKKKCSTFFLPMLNTFQCLWRIYTSDFGKLASRSEFLVTFFLPPWVMAPLDSSPVSLAACFLLVSFSIPKNGTSLE